MQYLRQGEPSPKRLGKITPSNLQPNQLVEPTEAQYLIINALDTLELLIENRYDQNTGIWYIYTPSTVLPFAMLRQNGDITPIEPLSEL